MCCLRDGVPTDWLFIPNLLCLYPCDSWYPLVVELTRSCAGLESRAASAEARADGLVASLATVTQELRESERRFEVEKRVLLEKIRALEGTRLLPGVSLEKTPTRA